VKVNVIHDVVIFKYVLIEPLCLRRILLKVDLLEKSKRTRGREIDRGRERKRQREREIERCLQKKTPVQKVFQTPNLLNGSHQF
jgi:hypothetical protein